MRRYALRLRRQHSQTDELVNSLMHMHKSLLLRSARAVEIDVHHGPSPCRWVQGHAKISLPYTRTRQHTESVLCLLASHPLHWKRAMYRLFGPAEWARLKNDADSTFDSSHSQPLWRSLAMGRSES